MMFFIPARGGSKGIVRKNLTLLCGKPLIQYTIEAAQKSKYVDEIFVSTDDYEIANFCRSMGVAVPYMRPPLLGEDDKDIVDVVIHALGWIQENRKQIPEDIILLQPTSPLRTSEDIDGAIEKFHLSKINSLVSINEMIHHPFECIKLTPDGWSFLQKPTNNAIRRQDYSEGFYFINGAIYIIKTNTLLSEKSFIIEGETDIYIMPKEHSVDIDSTFDLHIAEKFLTYSAPHKI